MDMDETLYNNDERIERYLHGEMTQEEETLFEKDLANNDTLRRRAEAIARMIKGMKAVGDEQDGLMIEKMKESLCNSVAAFTMKEPTDETTADLDWPAASAESRTSRTWWMAIAASLVIIFTVGYHFYDRSQTIGLGKQYAYVFSDETESLIRGEENEDVANKLTVLFDNATSGKDLDNTINQLEELWALSKSDTYNAYTTYEPYIGWNLAIAHLRNNDKKEAKKILDKMMEHYPEGTALGNKIIELKEKI